MRNGFVAALIAVFLLVACLCMPCAAQSVVPKLQVGSGGFLMKQGVFQGKTAAGVSRWSWNATTGVLAATPSTTTGTAWLYDFSTLTSGNGLKIKYLSGTLNGGSPFSICGGTTGTIVELSYGEGGVITLADGGSITPGDINGTTLTSMLLTPKSSVATTSISYHKLVAIGHLSGTYDEFGDITKPTTGLNLNFGRETHVATSAFTGTDTSLNVYAINKAANDAAYQMQGAYIKSKNYSGGTIGTMKGLFIEVDNGGTCTNNYGLDIGVPAGTVTDIRLQNAETIDNATNGTINLTATTVKATGNLVSTGSIAGLRPVAAGISGTSATLTVAAYPSGSLIPVTAATTAITLPAVTSGCTYTFFWKGGTATSLTLTAPSACLAVDGQTALKTSAVWTTTGLYLCVTVVADADSWIITSMTTAPDSAS